MLLSILIVSVETGKKSPTNLFSNLKICKDQETDNEDQKADITKLKKEHKKLYGEGETHRQLQCLADDLAEVRFD
ncbi:hypothetical protein L6452_01823 [Arctium lappa]|uniref:Uncharacterized protein n=1 Tax=Arctium lappa TaxID=4217 RepID=A0ACB9FJ76_ARCLA|nr:hypothetical protein L6452_01823 [Arctium lappa]